MERSRSRHASRSEERARAWISERMPEPSRRSTVKDVQEGTFFVKRKVDVEKTDQRIFDAISNLHQRQPNLEVMKILSVSIISPGDGNRLQEIARETDKSLHLGRIQEKVQTDFDKELTVYVGGVACFGARRSQRGKRFPGYYLSNAEQTLAGERQQIIDMYSSDLTEKRTSPHLSIASTKDQLELEAALEVLRETDVRGAELVLEPAEFGYAYFRSGRKI